MQLASKIKAKTKSYIRLNRSDGQMALIAMPSLVPRPYGLRTRLGKTHRVDTREHKGPRYRGYKGAQGSKAQGLRGSTRVQGMGDTREHKGPRHEGYEGAQGSEARGI